MTRRWTPEMREEVRQRRLAGETLAKIGAAYGVCPERIRQIAPLQDTTEERRAIAERRRTDELQRRNDELRRRMLHAYLEMRPEFIAWARSI